MRPPPRESERHASPGGTGALTCRLHQAALFQTARLRATAPLSTASWTARSSCRMWPSRPSRCRIMPSSCCRPRDAKPVPKILCAPGGETSRSDSAYHSPIVAFFNNCILQESPWEIHIQNTQNRESCPSMKGGVERPSESPCWPGEKRGDAALKKRNDYVRIKMSSKICLFCQKRGPISHDKS